MRIVNLKQVVLFEGWMLGFQPVDSTVYNSIDPQVSFYFPSEIMFS